MAMTLSNPKAAQQADRLRVALLTCTLGTEIFAPKGLYAAGTAYAAGDVVTYGGAPYLSLQAANTGHQPDVSPTWWAPLLALGKPAFSAAVAAAVGDVVWSAGILHQALQVQAAPVANAPAGVTDAWWRVLPHAGAFGLDLRGLQAVGGAVELSAGEVLAGTLLGYLIDPASGQVNRAPDFDVTNLVAGNSGQGLPGWAVNGPAGWLILVPSGMGAVHPKIFLNGSVRPSLLGG